MKYNIGCYVLSTLALAGLFAITTAGMAVSGFEPSSSAFGSFIGWGFLVNLFWTMLFHEEEGFAPLNRLAMIVQASSVVVFAFLYAYWACMEIPNNLILICAIWLLMGFAGFILYGTFGIAGSLIGKALHTVLVRRNSQQGY